MTYSIMVGYGIISERPCGGRGKGGSAEDEDSADDVDDRGADTAGEILRKYYGRQLTGFDNSCRIINASKGAESEQQTRRRLLHPPERG